MWKSKIQRLGFYPWENRFLSSYWTIIIWQFKIVIYFISGIYHVSCALNPQLKFLDATFVQDTSEGSDITGGSLSFPSLNLLYSFRIQKARGTTKYTHSPVKRPQLN